jgi:hypothetical protein
MRLFFNQLPYKVLILLLAIFISACFGGNIYKRGSVTGFKHGTVYTHGGSFRIGTLPDYWHEKTISYRALLFENDKDHSTITVDAWCKSAVDDSSLEVLSQHLYRGLEGFKVMSQNKLFLSGREALRTDVSGKVDGVPVFMSTYVLKLNSCVYDFIYVGFESKNASFTDFIQMIDGFQYLKGPRIL